MSFRYKLQKYTGQNSRFVCPQCHKNEYVRFIDQQTNEYLPFEYGRCNREMKCGYFKYPSQINNYDFKFDSSKIQLVGREAPIEFLSIEVLGSYKVNPSFNPLFQFLINHFPFEQVLKCFDDYQVKTEKFYNDFLTIYPQINTYNQLCTLKMMKYNSLTGKREKTFFKWFNPAKLNLKQCLFGLHLLNRSDRVYIVESEKTAMICSLKFPRQVFMATGGLNNLSRDKLYPLKGKQVVLIPDLSPTEANVTALKKWESQGAKIAKVLNMEIYINNLLEEISTNKQKNEQWDIGDFIIEQQIKY